MTWRQLQLLEKKTDDSSTKGGYFVIRFKCDETLSVIDGKKILSEINPEVGCTCDVQWSKKKVYEAVVLAKESNKKDAEMVMANYIVERTSVLHENNVDRVKKKQGRKSQKKRDDRLMNKENDPPTEETLEELAKGLKPGEGKFILELGSPGTPVKKHDKDLEAKLQEELADSETQSLNISSEMSQMEPGTKMAIDITSFEKTPERKRTNCDKFHPQGDNCCKCHLLEPMIREILSIVHVLGSEINSIKEMLKPPTVAGTAFMERSQLPSQQLPPLNFTAEPSSYHIPDAMPHGWTRPPFLPIHKSPAASPIDIMITDVEQVSPISKKPRYEDDGLDYADYIPPPLPPQLYHKTPSYPQYERPIEDPFWYKDAKTTPRTSMPTSTCKIMKPEEVFTLDFLLNIKRKSCSVGNFAANLTRSLFTEEERRCSNVRGKKDKRQLNPGIVSKIIGNREGD